MSVQEPTFRTIDLSKTASSSGTKIIGSNGQPINAHDFLKQERQGAIEKVASTYQHIQDPYPSPFLNLSDTKIPNKMSDLFKWCRYFYMFDPLIAGAINSLATFPVTDIYLEESKVMEQKFKDQKEDSPQLKTYKKTLFGNINLNKLLIEIGIDYWLYGNCFVFGEFWTNPDTKEKEWKHVVRLDPSKMIIDHNEATREVKYKWQVSERIQGIVKNKKPAAEYDKIPEIIKEAVRKNEAVVLNPNNIYHFARPTDSMGDTIWGTPSIANVMKLLMYRNVLRQAQEAIAREHIVPFRVYYFEKTNTYDTHTNWTNVTDSFAAELNKASKDPNYKVISPVPVNVLNLGGNGRALLLTPEIEQVQAEILAGMNVPREFIFGGVSWSGSSISLKILENQFITYRLLLEDFLQNFLIKNMARMRKEWSSENDDQYLVAAHMVDLKMQDDVQQKQLTINLNGAGKVTDEVLWKTLGFEPDKMVTQLENEALKKVELETKIQMARIKAGVDIQQQETMAQVEMMRFKLQLRDKLSKSSDPIDREIAMQMFGAGQPLIEGQPMTGEQPAPGEQMPPGSEGQMEPPMLGAPDTADMANQPDATNSLDQRDAADQQDGGNIESVIAKIMQLPKDQRALALSQLPSSTQQAIAEQMRGGSQDNYGKGFMEAQRIALQILKLPEESRQQALASLPAEARNKVIVAMQHLMPDQETERREEQKNTAAQGEGIDMRPMPEQRPPRRNSLK